MERLSALDASFLRVETPVAHMHVGWLAELRLPEGRDRIDLGEFRERIASKLHLAPRFRQRLRDAPVGEPFWADDPRFDLGSHVVESPGPPDAGAPLREICDGFLSRQLDRNRPLWEILVVPRTAPGRAAVLGKVHHALVDGIAAVQLGVLLFDLDPDPERESPPPWEPAAPSPARIAAESVADLALAQFRTAGRAARMGLRPGQALRAAGSARRAAFSLAGELARPAPESFLRAPLTPARTLIPSRVDMARAKRLAAAAEVKLNDVILAIVTGALRELAVRIGEPPIAQRTMVPISTRDGEQGGNRITFGFIDLPVQLSSAHDRLREVVSQMAELKRSRFAAGSDLLLRSTAAMPSALKTGVARAAASPRTYNLTVSNVPGPKLPLFAAGARVISVHPVIPISDGHALSIGVVSYDGALHFGVYADPTVLPAAAQLEALLPAELGRLEATLPAGWSARGAKVRPGTDQSRPRGAAWRSRRAPSRVAAGVGSAAARPRPVP